MNKYLILMLTLVSLLIIALVAFWLYESNAFSTRASQVGQFSKNNTYVFVTPLEAKADGNELIRIYCFVLDDRGLGVVGKKCRIANSEEIKIQETQPYSDNSGKVILDISAIKKASYKLEFAIDDIPLPQKIVVAFN